MGSNKVIIAAATIFALSATGCSAINSAIQNKVSDAKSTVSSVEGTAVSSAKSTAAPQLTKAVAAVTKEANSEATDVPEGTVAPSSGDSGFNMDNLDNGLDKLKSYREHMVYSFEGKDAKGVQQKSSLDLLQEVIVETKDQHIKMSNNSADSAGKSYETFQVGGSTFIYNNTGGADSSCTSFSSTTTGQNDPTALFKPRDMLGNLQSAKLVQKGENVNGVMTDHYLAVDKDFGMGLFSNAKGDVWVAQDGKWVVKYVGEASGKTPLLGAGVEGKIAWEYNITDANAVNKIDLPAVCSESKPDEDIPVPANVTEKGNLGNMVTFKSPDDIAKITDFYRTALTGQGWKEGEGGTEGIMSFTKDKRTLNIMMTKEDSGGSNVVITDAKGK